MKEKPILFQPWKVNKILEWDFDKQGNMQTRRIIPESLQLCESPEDAPETFIQWCKYGQPGEHLWVRETWNVIAVDERDNLYKWWSDVKASERNHLHSFDGVSYKADHNPRDEDYPWVPSIFMPRWASRITLEVVNVRVERVQDISKADAQAEGVTPVGSDLDYLKYRAGFQTLWNSINAKRGYGWNANPWCWVVEFRKI
jgi:hypothetical protein